MGQLQESFRRNREFREILTREGISLGDKVENERKKEKIKYEKSIRNRLMDWVYSHFESTRSSCLQTFLNQNTLISSFSIQRCHNGNYSLEKNEFSETKILPTHANSSNICRHTHTHTYKHSFATLLLHLSPSTTCSFVLLRRNLVILSARIYLRDLPVQ